MKPLQDMADFLRREARGIGDTGATILANAAAQPVQGYTMLARLLAGDDLGAAVEKGQRISYAPRTREGARNLGAIGDAADWALQYPMRAVDAVGEQSPLAGAGLLAGAAVLDPSKGAGRAAKLAKALRYDAGSPQALLPGVDPLTTGQLHERAARDLGEAGDAVRAAQEAADASQFAPHNRILGAQPTREVPPELAATLSDAIRRNRAAREAEAAARAGHLRAQRDTPGDTLDAAEARESELLRMKTGGDIDATGRELSDSRNLVRQLRQAQSHMAAPEPELPAWARNLTDDPSGAGRGGAPAGQDWWQEQLAQPPAAVAEFLRSVRDVPEAFTYGLEPPSSVQSLDDYAAWFSKQDPKKRRVRVDYEGGNDPEYIKQKREHGRGEIMYDRWGAPKGETRAHDWGDYPMYDESGNVKKDVDPDTGEKVKRRAEGGEPKRDSYGDEVFEYRKSRGGETMRDESGDVKYEEVEDPDYRGDSTAYLRAGGDEIKIEDWDSGRPSVYAIDAGDSGALLYQTLLAHASREGYPIGTSTLTDDNKLRLLSNTLANAARTGTNPRDVTGTASGARPKAKGRAEGDRIWQALAGETDARIAKHGGDPDAVRFTGEGFVGPDGTPLAPGDIADRLDEFSPHVGKSKAGLKTVMQNAVFKWLEQADPEQARRAARGWSRIGGPLFGMAGSAIGLEALTEHMRNQQAEHGPQ